MKFFLIDGFFFNGFLDEFCLFFDMESVEISGGSSRRFMINVFNVFYIFFV